MFGSAANLSDSIYLFLARIAGLGQWAPRLSRLIDGSQGLENRRGKERKRLKKLREGGWGVGSSGRTREADYNKVVVGGCRLDLLSVA